MPFVGAPDTVRATLEFVWAGQIVAITISVKKPTGWDSTDYDDLNDALRSWWTSSLKGRMSDRAVLQKINILDLSSPTAPSIEYPVTPPEPGSVVIASVPNNTSLVTSFKTDLRGRSYRGRAYMVGIPISDTLNSVTATTTYATNMTLVWLALTAALTALSMQHVVVSRYTNNAPRLVADVTPITEYFTEVNLDSQRRRLAGRGT